MEAMTLPSVPTQTNLLRRRDKRRHYRIALRLNGRFLFEGADHTFWTVNVSCGGALLRASDQPPIGTKIVCYFDEIGRIEATIVRHANEYVAIRFKTTVHKREKLTERLMWLLNKDRYDLKDARTTPRVAKSARAMITLSGGRKVQCRVVDISLSGAAFKQDGPPLVVGEIIKAGNIKGEVVRSDTEGFAIRFLNRKTA